MLTKKWTLLGLALLLMGFGFSPAVQANVSLKNGNFFIGYVDIIYPGGFEPKVERVYNSKTPYKGMFGWGWGTEYEVYLTVSADGSVVVNEFGGGAQNRFNPVKFNKNELKKAVDAIASVARKTGAVGSSSQLSKYKARLLKDATFRNDEWEKYRAQGKIKPRVLANGTQLQSNRFSYQYITKVKSGYVRTFDNGRIEQFDDDGHLVKIQDKNNNFIKFSYSKDGRLNKMADNFNRKMFFTFDTQGLLVKIDGVNNKKATFSYNKIGELIESKDVDGNIYKYSYSSDKRHNLTSIVYADKTSMQVAYHPIGLNENVREVIDRDGTKTTYDYEYNKGSKGQFKISVQVYSKGGKKISSSVYDYHLKYKSNGEEWTYKLVTLLDGQKTETIYNECCGLPLMIKRNGKETNFEYDRKGHVVKKSTPNEITKLSYHPKLGKVTKVVRYSKTNKKKVNWSQFKYDNNGNLLFAKNSQKQGVRLFYDDYGRIKSMVDQNRRRIDFEYNENSKPIKITDPTLGSITVSYRNSGEIKKVESSAGRKIALQVTSAFQNLLDIIRPAGVTLAF